MQKTRKKETLHNLENPFHLHDQGDSFLTLEHCQYIHYNALQEAVRHNDKPAFRDESWVATLKTQSQVFGSDVYLRHPDEIRAIFAGVNTAVFKATQTLYCSRLGRSIRMVWKILSAMAQAEDTVPPSYEAIWALCSYFKEARREQMAVSVERGAETWWIAALPSVTLSQAGQPTQQKQFQMLCCVDLTAQHVLAFRCIPQGVASDEQINGVFYDALTARRRPHPYLPTGLLWHLPKHLMITSARPQECQLLCRQLCMSIESTTDRPPLLSSLQKICQQELAGQVSAEPLYSSLFDTLLQKIHGHGPRRAQKMREKEYTHLVGYQRGPAWQFPLLRTLLVSQSGCIAEDGLICDGDLHYEHPLLRYWHGTSVTFRRPADSEAYIWVYINHEILCQAFAQELRRGDGSYRNWRVGRG